MKKELRQLIHAKYQHSCAYCGRGITYQQLQVDHIISKELWHKDGRGKNYGLDDIENLNPACRVCNKWKDSKTVEEFRHEIEMQVERARQYSRNFRMAERYELVAQIEKKVVFWFEWLARMEGKV